MDGNTILGWAMIIGACLLIAHFLDLKAILVIAFALFFLLRGKQ